MPKTRMIGIGSHKIIFLDAPDSPNLKTQMTHTFHMLLPTWRVIGIGAYNAALLSPDGLDVLKIQIIMFGRDHSDDYDRASRSVELWNKINPHIYPPARKIDIKPFGQCWISPFIKGRQSTDLEIFETVLKIFNATGRIIIDAAIHGNFITSDDGQVVCVDIGQALELEQRDGEILVAGQPRRKSITSIYAWREQERGHISYLNDPEMNAAFPVTIKTIKALLFIKLNYPDIFDVNFLKSNMKMISQLAARFDSGDKTTSFDFHGFASAPDTAGTDASTALSALTVSASDDSAATVSDLKKITPEHCSPPQKDSLTAKLGFFSVGRPPTPPSQGCLAPVSVNRPL